MKIAVYTIVKNEEKFIERWYNSAKNADYLMILDTGSSDRTVEIAQSLGIRVHSAQIDPWRFDVARNYALSLLPDDIDWCISLDADEVLSPEWRAHVESAEKESTRLRYKYVWSWGAGGKEGLVFAGDKIHRRYGYEWKHPVHEVLFYEGEEKQEFVGLEIHHHPDHTKPRTQYLDLLKLAVEEDPEDDRNAHYYARELLFAGKIEEAIQEFERHLSLESATWKAERAASMIFLSRCDYKNKEGWLLKAHSEDSTRREPMVSLALYYFERKDYEQAITWARSAIAIKEKPMDYLCEDYAWGSVPYDVLANSYYHRRRGEEARKYGIMALLEDPNNDRLIDNLRHYVQI